MILSNRSRFVIIYRHFQIIPCLVSSRYLSSIISPEHWPIELSDERSVILPIQHYTLRKLQLTQISNLSMLDALQLKINELNKKQQQKALPIFMNLVKSSLADAIQLYWSTRQETSRIIKMQYFTTNFHGDTTMSQVEFSLFKPNQLTRSPDKVPHDFQEAINYYGDALDELYSGEAIERTVGYRGNTLALFDFDAPIDFSEIISSIVFAADLSDKTPDELVLDLKKAGIKGGFLMIDLSRSRRFKVHSLSNPSLKALEGKDLNILLDMFNAKKDAS